MSACKRLDQYHLLNHVAKHLYFMKIQERRQYPRIEIDYVTVEVYKSFQKSTEVEEICPVLNLSENGMKFSAEQSFAIEQLLRLTFVLPDSMVVIRTDAIIVHLSAAQNKNMLDVGVQFKNIGIAERKLISHFIDKKLSEIPHF